MLFVPVLSILLYSCTKELTYHRDDIEPQLLVNAQMTVGDTLHVVYLAIEYNLGDPMMVTLSFPVDY